MRHDFSRCLHQVQSGRAIAVFKNLLFASFLLFGACGRKNEGPGTSSTAAKTKQSAESSSSTTPVLPPKIAPDFQTPWQTEAEYVVTRVVSELANLFHYAKSRTALTDTASAPAVTVTRLTGSVNEAAVFRVRIAFATNQIVECDLPLVAGIFSVETYRPLAAQLEQIAGSKLKAETSAESTEPESTLLQDKPSVLLAMDRALSERLQTHFNDPELHEQAALLINAFAWRDCSERFFNLLPELTRSTAHLVFADKLRSGAPAGNRSTLNRALVAALIGDQALALEAAEQLPLEQPFSRWKRVVRMRVTEDYRTLSEIDDPSLLERLEWYRAFAFSVDGEILQSRYTIPKDLRVLPDWWRVLNGAKTSVQIGHLLSAYALRAEIAEATDALVAYGNEKPATIATLVTALNAPEVNSVQSDTADTAHVNVLGWNLWAQLLQRQICYAIAGDYHFMQEMWGVPEKAREYRSRVDESFGTLALYPLVRRLNSTSETYYHEAQDQAMKLVRTTPERVPAWAWNAISDSVSFCPRYIPPPHPFINEWHCDNPLPGTAYDLEPRLFHPSLWQRSDITDFTKRLSQMAPYSKSLIHQKLVRDKKKEIEPEEAIQAYAPMLEYSPFLQRYVAGLFAKRKDNVEQEQWLKRSVVIDPTGFETLAHLYRNEKRDDEAAAAYSQWIANETDSVAIANDSGWLIQYFEKHGRADQANNLADKSAEVYSFRGLAAKAQLLEGRKRYGEALEYYQKIAERYEAPGAVIGFLLRHQTPADNRCEPELLTHLLETYFPNGLTKFDPSMTAHPTAGVLVSLRNAKIIQAGLKRNDIIISIRGYVVSDWPHFEIIRDFDRIGDYEITVWRGEKIVKIAPLRADYQFGSDLPTYHQTGSSNPQASRPAEVGPSSPVEKERQSSQVEVQY